jgi:hypothetical protein
MLVNRIIALIGLAAGLALWLGVPIWVLWSAL